MAEIKGNTNWYTYHFVFPEKFDIKIKRIEYILVTWKSNAGKKLDIKTV